MLDIKKIPEDQISAVHSLEGKTLKSGWKVIEKLKLNQDQRVVIFLYVT